MPKNNRGRKEQYMNPDNRPSAGADGKEKPRLTDFDRLSIETGLNDCKTPYAIAQEIGRPPKTVMREIRNRAVESDRGAVGRVSNRCVHRYDCQRKNVCKACYQRRSMSCKFCSQCNSHCADFREDECERLKSSPFVCNGCGKLRSCTLRKRFYRHADAKENYRKLLVESRRGANIAEEELLKFDELLYTLTRNGQSVHAAVANNPDAFSVSEKTLYRYIDGGLLRTRNGDLPRKCKVKPRKAKPVEHKVDAQCRIGRTWEDYQKFVAEHPGLPLTEMDTVEGVRGGKVLMTLMFMPYGFMLAFLLDAKTAANVNATFELIRDRLVGRFGKDMGLAVMGELFFVLVTDNGTEFSNPKAIEFDREGNRVANLFYANACASYQKPHAERNHEFIRLFLPKGTCYFLPTSFDGLTQKDVDLMMSHINSYVRAGLKDRTPYDLITQRHGVEFAELFGITRIPANEVVLMPRLLGIEQKVRPEILAETEPKKK